MADISEFFLRDRFAGLAGAKVISAENGCAVAEMKVTAEHMNGLRTVQGGAIFTLADLAFAAACNSHGNVAVAVDADIKFIHAVTGGTLTAKARELSVNRRLGSYEVLVEDDTGRIVATFHGLAYRKELPLEQAAEMGDTNEAQREYS